MYSYSAKRGLGHRSMIIAARVLLAAALPTAAAGEGVIDFESVPSGAPSLGLEITDQYWADFGVKFSISGSDEDTMRLGDYGGLREGWSSSYGYDSLRPEYDFGGYFLAHPDLGAVLLRDVLIEYDTPTEELGFHLMDIDSTEAWTITVYDASAGPIGQKIYDPSDGGDALPTHVTFTQDDTGGIPISGVRIHYSGDLPDAAVGFGFDDFTAYTIPEPATFALLGMGGLALLRRRRQTSA